MLFDLNTSYIFSGIFLLNSHATACQFPLGQDSNTATLQQEFSSVLTSPLLVHNFFLFLFFWRWVIILCHKPTSPKLEVVDLNHAILL